MLVATGRNRLGSRRLTLSQSRGFGGSRSVKMPVHHLMIGTWTPPGAIFTVQFDDEKLELKLVKRTKIPHDEPISWMAFDVSDGALVLKVPRYHKTAHTLTAYRHSTPKRTFTVRQ
jgi:hypothetical protein